MELWADFVAVVRQLRRDCPWDREQTHDSVKHLLIEETFEAVDAIDRGDIEDLRGELGDVLLHVVFHSAMAEESGSFVLGDVIRDITSKLVRRHPHVFGEVAVGGVGEVLENWEAIKLSEAGSAGRPKRVLDGVPGALPSLLRAQRIQEKVAGVGFDFPDASAAWTKVEEELEEFRDAERGTPADREAEFGDLLFSLVNYARLSGLTPENALRATCNKFAGRFAYVEDRLESIGSSPAKSTLEEMDAIWDEARGK